MAGRAVPGRAAPTRLARQDLRLALDLRPLGSELLMPPRELPSAGHSHEQRKQRDGAVIQLQRGEETRERFHERKEIHLIEPPSGELET